MTIRYPGLTFSNLERQHDIEAYHQGNEWWDNMGQAVTPVVDDVFCGRLAFSDTLVVSVARNGFSRGGYLGLFEIAFLNPQKARLPFGDQTYEPYELGLEGVTLTWLTEADVTVILQRVARHLEHPLVSSRGLVIGLLLSGLLMLLGTLLWYLATY